MISPNPLTNEKILFTPEVTNHESKDKFKVFGYLDVLSAVALCEQLIKFNLQCEGWDDAKIKQFMDETLGSSFQIGVKDDKSS